MFYRLPKALHRWSPDDFSTMSRQFKVSVRWLCQTILRKGYWTPYGAAKPCRPPCDLAKPLDHSSDPATLQHFCRALKQNDWHAIREATLDEGGPTPPLCRRSDQRPHWMRFGFVRSRRHRAKLFSMNPAVPGVASDQAVVHSDGAISKRPLLRKDSYPVSPFPSRPTRPAQSSKLRRQMLEGC